MAVASELHLENSNMRREMQEALDSKDIQMREKLKAATKRSSLQINSLKQVITSKDRDISEVNDMAISMADEYSDLNKKAQAQRRDTSYLLEHHKKLATTRLEKMSAYKEESESHRLFIESLQEEHAEELASVKEEVDSLTKQLRDCKDKIQSLESELSEAVEEIVVSFEL